MKKEQRIWNRLIRGKLIEEIIKDGIKRREVENFIKDWGWLVEKVRNKLNIPWENLIVDEYSKEKFAKKNELTYLREENKDEFFCILCQSYIDINHAFLHIKTRHEFPSLPFQIPLLRI